ncbi:MAG: FtsX-like permease family protein [Ruminococcaceae bacterium]|nr:FtsX-like permease family protein [Oscillospiraceae bacterium]
MRVDITMLRSIRRSFTEGIKGMVKNGLMTVTSLLVVTACIFVFGVFLMCIFNINYMTDKMADNYQVKVYVSKSVQVESDTLGIFIEEDISLTPEQYEEKKKEIETLIIGTENVDISSIEFVSAKDRYENFLETLSDKEKESYMYEDTQHFPLGDSFSVKLEDNSKEISTIIHLDEIVGVSEVLNGNEIYASYASAGSISSSITDAKYEEIKAGVKAKIEQIPNIDTDNIEMIDGKKYFADFKAELSEEELQGFVGLPDDLIEDAFVVRLLDLSKAEETIAALSDIENVKNIENNRELIAIIENLEDVVKTISIWIIVVFALVSLFIISNTIKLTVHNRRKEINIMKYVGATDSYIRGPFIMEGILLGIISALISFFISLWCYEGLLAAIASGNSVLPIVTSIAPFGLIWPELIGAYLVMGAVIGAFGSFISVRRYTNV